MPRKVKVTWRPALANSDVIGCERCGERLDHETAVWLELNNVKGVYVAVGSVPKSESQGCFAFGAACARTVTKNGGVLVRIRRRGIR